MHIEVIVRVNGGQAAAANYDRPSVMEITVGEAVAPDPVPKYGEEGYGRPHAEHPWLRAEQVVEYLASAAKSRTREKLSELAALEATELSRRIAEWEAQQSKAAAAPAPL